MSELIKQLEDLHKQATTENSHFYVANCVEKAISKLTILQTNLDEATLKIDGLRHLLKVGVGSIKIVTAEVNEAKQILQDIINEKKLHGQVVDGTMAARKFLDRQAGITRSNALLDKGEK